MPRVVRAGVVAIVGVAADGVHGWRVLHGPTHVELRVRESALLSCAAADHVTICPIKEPNRVLSSVSEHLRQDNVQRSVLVYD